MRITFNLEGQEKTIKWDGHCFHALDPNVPYEKALGYYKTIGGAVDKHVQNHIWNQEKDFETIVSLEDFHKSFQNLREQVLGLTKDSLYTSVFKVTEIPKKEMSEEHKEKLRKLRESKKCDPVDEEEDDIF